MASKHEYGQERDTERFTGDWFIKWVVKESRPVSFDPINDFGALVMDIDKSALD